MITVEISTLKMKLFSPLVDVNFLLSGVKKKNPQKTHLDLKDWKQVPCFQLTYKNITENQRMSVPPLQ